MQSIVRVGYADAFEVSPAAPCPTLSATRTFPPHKGEGGAMVGVAGFEPATPASRTRCSTRLSHTPIWKGRL
jgi:hypothetical protein